MKTTIVILACCSLLLVGCSSDSGSDQKDEVILGKIELSDGWARPASKGQTSSVYLTIDNGTATADTLTKISSDAAARVEIHESYEKNGVSGMRPAGKQIIPSAQELQFQPGGLHIMLMDLTRNMAIGDSISVTFNFARVGTKQITVPVQIQN